MFEYKKSLRKMTNEEDSLILTAICNINNKPNEIFTVYCDTSNAACVPFIATLIRRVRDNCRGITGCMIYSDRVVFGENKKKVQYR